MVFVFFVSWEQQTHHAADRPDPLLGHFVVTRGEDMWLKMVLNDGLLHADLHPGNVLIHAPQVPSSTAVALCSNGTTVSAGAAVLLCGAAHGLSV